MIRYAFVLLAAMGTVAAAATFAQAPAGVPAGDAVASLNQTVVAKNSVYPVLDSAEGWTECKTEDCSDVPNE